jgi:hypothetical protein
MRLRLASCVILITACASASGAPSTTHPVVETARVTSGSQIGMDMMATNTTHSVTVSAPLAVVWSLLPAVFDSVGITVATSDPTTHEIGNRGFAVGRQIGGVMTSRFFDCGSNGGASSAFSYDLFVNIITVATPTTSAMTSVATQIDVRGRPVSTSGAWLQCASTGALEQKIAETLDRAIKRSL